MSEFKFSCPKCGQKMFGDEQYAGMQITCPSCQNEIVIPQQLQPAAHGSVQAKTISVSTRRPSQPAAATIPVTQVRPAYMPRDSSSQNSKAKVIAITAVICLVILAPIIFFFAFPDQVNALESKFGFADKKVDPDADGGQLGHIADLYAVLDATDPDKMAMEDSKSAAKFRKELQDAERAADEAEKEAALAEANTPLGEVAWNLNPGDDIIPTGRPHGSISGTEFVADIVRLDKNENQYLLTLQQGTNAVPDREVQIYLQLKPDERIEGKSWTILASQKTGAPRIIKKWKANPKFAPLQKIYGGGYAMLLDFGKARMGRIPAVIYVALPDAEKSFFGGEFKVDEFRERINFRDDFDEF